MVVLLFGGRSTEHRVSVASAQNLCEVLRGAELWWIRREGAVQPCTAAALRAHERPFELDFAPEAAQQWPSLDAALASCPPEAVFFLALHGGEGEDGTVQARLERGGFAFTGSGSAASACAFDKRRAKALVAARGIRTPRAVLAQGPAALLERVLREQLEQRGALIAKPVADGSSIGLHRIDAAADIPKLASEIAACGVPYLIEDQVCGRELTVGVLDEDGESLALPLSEVVLEGATAFDYAGKYLGRGTREITPAQVPAELAREAQRIAVIAHRELGCEGYSRTDLIAAADGIDYLETNTLPGLTRASFIPQQLAAAGRTLQDFVDAQLGLARVRRARAAARLGAG